MTTGRGWDSVLSCLSADDDSPKPLPGPSQIPAKPARGNQDGLSRVHDNWARLGFGFIMLGAN